MPSQYIEYLLNSERWWLFFDRYTARAKAKEIVAAGFQAKIYKEREQYTVFKIK